MAKHRFTNLYFTTTLSITLVLFLLGLFTSVLVVSYNASNKLKQNVTFTVMLSDSASSAQIERMVTMLDKAPYSSSVRYISKDDALREHIEQLGENPELFLGYNPLSATIQVSMAADYAFADSIAPIAKKLETMPTVQQVVYQPDVIEKLDKNIQVVTMVFLIVMAVLVIISAILINSTIRLGVYSRRFLIHTMSLVGATSWRIRAPFVRQHFLMGIIAALLSLLMLGATGYYVQTRLGIILTQDMRLVYIVAGAVFAFGILLTVLCSNASAARYVRMKYDDLFYA